MGDLDTSFSALPRRSYDATKLPDFVRRENISLASSFYVAEGCYLSAPEGRQGGSGVCLRACDESVVSAKTVEVVVYFAHCIAEFGADKRSDIGHVATDDGTTICAVSSVNDILATVLTSAGVIHHLMDEIFSSHDEGLWYHRACYLGAQSIGELDDIERTFQEANRCILQRQFLINCFPRYRQWSHNISRSQNLPVISTRDSRDDYKRAGAHEL